MLFSRAHPAVRIALNTRLLSKRRRSVGGSQAVQSTVAELEGRPCEEGVVRGPGGRSAPVGYVLRPITSPTVATWQRLILSRSRVVGVGGSASKTVGQLIAVISCDQVLAGALSCEQRAHFWVEGCLHRRGSQLPRHLFVIMDDTTYTVQVQPYLDGLVAVA